MPGRGRDYEEWTQSDQVFSGIFKACAASPDRCSLARPGKSAADLERSAWELFAALKRRPVAIDRHVDENMLRRFVTAGLYTTTAWKNLTDVLAMLESGDVDERAVLERMQVPLARSEDDLEVQVNRTVGETMPFFGIHCLDRGARARTYDAVLPAVRRLFRLSGIMGGAVTVPTVTCAQWKLEPKERYRGDFCVRPRKPVLLIGNTYDGHTPIASARNVSAGFNKSVVLKVNGYGVRLPCAGVPQMED